MAIAISSINISKKNLTTKEQFQITVRALEPTADPVAYRLPFRLGEKTGYHVGQK